MLDTIINNKIEWTHIINPTDENLTILKDKYNFHHLDIEDCKSKQQRPKIDIYNNYYFLILHFPDFDQSNILTTKEIKIFWGKNFLITIGKSKWLVADMFNEAKNNKLFAENLMNESTDKLLYHILYKLITYSENILKEIEKDLNFIDNNLFNKKTRQIIEKISFTRKNIIQLNTITKPQLRLFEQFELSKVHGFAKDMQDYWSNIYDYYQKIWDTIEDYEEFISNLSRTFDSLQTNMNNEIIKVLTFFSSIMLPLTFITSLYGMNIGLPFQNHPLSFWMIVIIMIAITLFLIYYFKHKKWM
jgi:magnesium transporter